MVEFLQTLDEVNSLYNDLSNHPSFQIRNRLFMGGGKYGAGLAELSGLLQEIQMTLKGLPERKKEFFGDELQKKTQELKKTLEMLITHHSMLSTEDLIKLKDVFRVELQDFAKKVNEIKEMPDQEIPTNEEMLTEELKELRQKIEDGFTALDSSYLWRGMVRNEGEDEVRVIKELQNQVIKNIANIDDVEILKFLAMFSAELRNIVTDSKDENLLLINFFLFLTELLEKPNSWKLSKPDKGNPSKSKITHHDVMLDLETKINRGMTTWLIYLFDDLEKNTPLESLDEVFVNELYQMSRDPIEFFMWTMSQFAYRKKDDELISLSETYATLASSLLSLIFDLENLGYSDIAKEVMEFNAINPSTAIDDIADLYDPKKINPNTLKNAIKKNMSELSRLATDISQLGDLEDAIIRVFNFSFRDNEFHTIEQVREFLLTLQN